MKNFIKNFSRNDCSQSVKGSSLRKSRVPAKRHTRSLQPSFSVKMQDIEKSCDFGYIVSLC